MAKVKFIVSHPGERDAGILPWRADVSVEFDWDAKDPDIDWAVEQFKELVCALYDVSDNYVFIEKES